MANTQPLSLYPSQALWIWLVGVTFVLFQFFLQLSSGVVIGAIMQEIQITAFQAGILGSAFYYVYAGLQIPVGVLFDKKQSRVLLAASALTCSIGCLYFAHSYQFNHLIMGRLLLGFGSAFAFVGLSHLLRNHFSLQAFGFLIGLSETLGFIVTVIGMTSLGALIAYFGWRIFINSSALIGLGIAYACWRFIPPNRPSLSDGSLRLHFKTILTTGKIWINGCFVGLGFSVITVFAAMWAIPFLKVKLQCDLNEASLVDSMVFLGAGISCPLFGKLDLVFKRRKPLLISSCLATAALFLIVLFAPIHDALQMGVLLLAMGICCGAYMLSYTIANELSPPNALSTCTGFTNTLAVLSAPLMQPLVGYCLDTLRGDNAAAALMDYQISLSIVPAALILASILVIFLPEKNRSKATLEV